MTKHVKLLLTTAATVVAFAAAAGPAAALVAEVDPAGDIEAASNGPVTFGSGLTQIVCPVTFNGTFSASPGFDVGDVIGAITEVLIATERCTGGTILEVLELPWTMDIRALQGTAPNALTGFAIDLNNMSFELEGAFGADCLYDGNAAGVVTLTGSNPYSTSGYGSLTEVTLPRNASSDFGCPATIGIRGSLDIAPVQNVRVI